MVFEYIKLWNKSTASNVKDIYFDQNFYQIRRYISTNRSGM